MTILVEVRNKNQGGKHNVRVHRVTFDPADNSQLVEDGVILQPGESKEFVIWGSVRLAIEEEYENPSLCLTPIHQETDDQDPTV